VEGYENDINGFFVLSDLIREHSGRNMERTCVTNWYKKILCFAGRRS